MSRQVLSASDAVREWAACEPDRVCLTFHGGGDAEPFTCRTLAEHASSYAQLYRARGLRPGDSVVLFADSTAALVAAFLGAQEASLLAVPCPPSEPLADQRTHSRSTPPRRTSLPTGRTCRRAAMAAAPDQKRRYPPARYHSFRTMQCPATSVFIPLLAKVW
jgi:acyl-CoA synthetase (AMP-forming)/AMP-acid ligase II